MTKKGIMLACGVLALLFVPGTIPTFIGVKTAKLKKRFATQRD